MATEALCLRVFTPPHFTPPLLQCSPVVAVLLVIMTFIGTAFRIITFPVLALCVCAASVFALFFALNVIWLLPICALASYAYADKKLTARGRNGLLPTRR